MDQDLTHYIAQRLSEDCLKDVGGNVQYDSSSPNQVVIRGYTFSFLNDRGVMKIVLDGNEGGLRTIFSDISGRSGPVSDPIISTINVSKKRHEGDYSVRVQLTKQAFSRSAPGGLESLQSRIYLAVREKVINPILNSVLGKGLDR